MANKVGGATEYKKKGFLGLPAGDILGTPCREVDHRGELKEKAMVDSAAFITAMTGESSAQVKVHVISLLQEG